jgi:hypothetical protein
VRPAIRPDALVQARDANFRGTLAMDETQTAEAVPAPLRYAFEFTGSGSE